jgi:hypothetical protein
MAGTRAPRLECDLYPEVKAFLERLGYEVKSVVRGCDVVATRSGEPPVIVELKLAFNLSLVLQGIDRLALSDRVYLAVARPRNRRAAGGVVYRRDVRNLCRRLGLGLMVVVPGRGNGATRRTGHQVEVLVDPVPYRPRKDAKRVRQMLGEHARRAGDPNRGGVSKVPLMTAYRQEACRCAMLMQRDGRANLQALRETGLVPNAPKILRRDVYGWFRRCAPATYELTDRARQDLARFGAAGALPSVDNGGEI